MEREILYNKGVNWITFCCQEATEESSEIGMREDKNLTEINNVLCFAARFASIIKGLKDFKKPL